MGVDVFGSKNNDANQDTAAAQNTQNTEGVGTSREAGCGGTGGSADGGGNFVPVPSMDMEEDGKAVNSAPPHDLGGGVGALIAQGTGRCKTTVRAYIPWWAKKCCGAILSFINPPVIGVLSAMLISLTPVREWLVDTTTRKDGAPLEWLFDGIYNIGRAAVPINMLILGSKLSRGANFKQVKCSVNLAIVVVKMVLMPAIGVGVAFLIRQVSLSGGGGARAGGGGSVCHRGWQNTTTRAHPIFSCLPPPHPPPISPQSLPNSFSCLDRGKMNHFTWSS